jgi:hypothetical protein
VLFYIIEEIVVVLFLYCSGVVAYGTAECYCSVINLVNCSLV